MVPAAGTGKALETSNTASGFPIAQPDANLAGGGASAASPSGAPESAHSERVSISVCEPRRHAAGFDGFANRFGEGARLLVGHQRHRGRLAGAVALLAAGLQNGLHVFVERDLRGRGGGGPYSERSESEQ
jgi:hypothetical protein